MHGHNAKKTMLTTQETDRLTLIRSARTAAPSNLQVARRHSISQGGPSIDVAIFLPSLRGGGAERVMVTLANAFAARGLKVDLVLASAEGPYLDEVSPTVRIVDLRARRVLTSLPGLVRYFRRERPRAMLSALNHANAIALLARRLAGGDTRIVVSERSHLSVSLCGPISLRGRAMPWFMRRTYPWADGVVAVSAGVADDLAATISLPRDSITVIHNPVVTDDMLAHANAPLNHPWFAPGAPPVIVGVGRLAPEKDFAVLIRAFARVRESRAAKLVILGEGELRTELEEQIRAQRLDGAIALPGFQPNPLPYMRRAALFVLSSRLEGLPNALIQAMACGTPVVSTDCPSGPAEILEGGKWGRLVQVGEVDALADAMLATLNETDRPDTAKRAQDFDANSAIDHYLRILMLDA